MYSLSGARQERLIGPSQIALMTLRQLAQLNSQALARWV